MCAYSSSCLTVCMNIEKKLKIPEFPGNQKSRDERMGIACGGIWASRKRKRVSGRYRRKHRAVCLGYCGEPHHERLPSPQGRGEQSLLILKYKFTLQEKGNVKRKSSKKGNPGEELTSTWVMSPFLASAVPSVMSSDAPPTKSR